MKHATSGLFAAALLAVTVAAEQPASKDDPGVAKVRSAYAAAVNKKDAKAVAALYTEDGVEMPPNQPSMKGRAAIEAFNKKFFAEFSPNLSIIPWETRVAGDWAFDAGAYTDTLTPVAGGGPIKDSGKYVVVFKRDKAGQWWAAYAIYNSDMPPPPPPMKK